MRISDWSSDVCSSDLRVPRPPAKGARPLRSRHANAGREPGAFGQGRARPAEEDLRCRSGRSLRDDRGDQGARSAPRAVFRRRGRAAGHSRRADAPGPPGRLDRRVNSEPVPRVLVNSDYYATVWARVRSQKEREYLKHTLQSPKWRVKQLQNGAKPN